MSASPGPFCCTTCSVGRLSSFPVFFASTASTVVDRAPGPPGDAPVAFSTSVLWKFTLSTSFPEAAARTLKPDLISAHLPRPPRSAAAHLRVG